LSLTGRREEKIGRQRGIRLIIQVTADAVAGGGLPRKVVLRPAEPARLDVAGDAPAIAKITFVDEATVIHRQITADDFEIDMPQGCAQYEARAMSGATFLVGLKFDAVPAATGP